MSEKLPPSDRAIETIPSYEFRKTTQLSAGEKETLSDYLRGLTIEWKGHPRPRQESGRRMFKISQLINNNFLWAKNELGLSLAFKKSDISLRKIKFYDREEFDKMVEAGEFPHWVKGSVKAGVNDAVILERPDERETLHDTNHELAHMLGRKVVSVKMENESMNITFQRIGYSSARNNFFTMLNEAVTEMINLETLAYYRDKSDIDYITGCDIGYPAAVIFFDMLINKLAERSGVSGQELRKDFYTGYFNGRFKYLSLFNEHLGKRSLKEIAGLPAYVFTDKPTKYTNILFKKIFKEADLNYDEFVEKFNGYNAGEKVKLYCGVEISKNIESSTT